MDDTTKQSIEHQSRLAKEILADSRFKELRDGAEGILGKFISDAFRVMRQEGGGLEQFYEAKSMLKAHDALVRFLNLPETWRQKEKRMKKEMEREEKVREETS